MVVVDEHPSAPGWCSPPPVLLDVSGLLEQPLQPVIELVGVLVAAPVQPPVWVHVRFDRGAPVALSVESTGLLMCHYRRRCNGNQEEQDYCRGQCSTASCHGQDESGVVFET